METIWIKNKYGGNTASVMASTREEAIQKLIGFCASGNPHWGKVSDWEEIPDPTIREFVFEEFPETEFVRAVIDDGLGGVHPVGSEKPTGRIIRQCTLVVDGAPVCTAEGIVGEITDEELKERVMA